MSDLAVVFGKTRNREQASQGVVLVIDDEAAIRSFPSS
jgi:hypothetical protein